MIHKLACLLHHTSSDIRGICYWITSVACWSHVICKPTDMTGPNYLFTYIRGWNALFPEQYGVFSSGCKGWYRVVFTCGDCVWQSRPVSRIGICNCASPAQIDLWRLAFGVTSADCSFDCLGLRDIVMASGLALGLLSVEIYNLHIRSFTTPYVITVIFNFVTTFKHVLLVI